MFECAFRQQLAASWLSSACMTSCHCISFLIGAALAQQQHRIELFELPVQEEYGVKSKASEAADMISKKKVAAMMKDKSTLQQQLKVKCGSAHFVHSC